MTKFLYVALAAVFALPLPACAQPAPAPAPAAREADPALWEVKDEDTTIYLFGTIHVLKPGLSWFDQAVRTAFDSSDTLVTEVVFPDPAAMQAIVAKTGLDPSGPPLSEKVPEAKRAAFRAAIAESGVPAAVFERTKPWLAAVQISMAPLTKLGFDQSSAPESVLGAAADKAGKKHIGLETVEQQFGYFNSLSAPAQMTLLTSTIDEMPKVAETFGAMVDDWSRGDPDALAKEMNDNLKDSPEVAKTILFDRNKRWAGWIAERMKRPGVVFVAVGAGHLAGPGSVQEELGAYKLKAVRVKY